MGLGAVNNVIKPPKKGGGVMGSVIGGVLGALAGALTGGAAAAPGAALGAAVSGAGTGLGLGMGAGGLAGELIDPSRPGSVNATVANIPTKKPALDYMLKLPEVQMATMQNAKNLLRVSDAPRAADTVGLIDQAQEKLRAQLGNQSSIRFPI